MQETLRQDAVFGGLRRRRGAVSILRQQESRAALVGLLRYHVQKERVTPFPGRHLCTGAYSRLPVMQEVQREAVRHKVKVLILTTIKAIKALQQDPEDTIHYMLKV